MQAAWAEPAFEAVALRSVRPSSGGGLFEVVVEAPDEFIANYKTPGQFVQIRPSADVKPGFFAIASPPRAASGTSGVFEFLIKEADSTRWITGASAGLGALMCAPMGKGFALDTITASQPGTNVAFCVAGSGVAPIRALIEAEPSILGVAPRVRTAQLFFGCQSLEKMPYRDRFEAWEQLGVQLVPVLSRTPSFTGAKGYVQDALRTPGLVKSPQQTVVVLCGGKDMAIAVKEVASSFGIPPERVLTNF